MSTRVYTGCAVSILAACLCGPAATQATPVCTGTPPDPDDTAHACTTSQDCTCEEAHVIKPDDTDGCDFNNGVCFPSVNCKDAQGDTIGKWGTAVSGYCRVSIPENGCENLGDQVPLDVHCYVCQKTQAGCPVGKEICSYFWTSQKHTLSVRDCKDE